MGSAVLAPPGVARDLSVRLPVEPVHDADHDELATAPRTAHSILS